MKCLLARLTPDGLAARFALLLVCALIAANIAALVLISFERDRLGREAREDREIERIVGLVPALEAVRLPVRRAIARDASTRLARVRIAPAPLVERTQADARSQALAARLGDSLGSRAVQVGIVERPGRWTPRRRDDEGRERRGGGHSGNRGGEWHETIMISIALTTPHAGQWLNVTTRGGRRPPRGEGGQVFFLILGLSLAAVLGVGLLFVRHLTRPLSRLADAARAAGRGDRSARVPEHGAREMRDAATAFNAMQTQIAGFDAERMRTLAAVGHDLRTPITSLRIRAEMLEDDLREPMVRTLDEMTVMADELVAYARGDAHGEERQTVDLAELLSHVCADRGASLGGVRGAHVSGRPVALTRALGNLIDNAIRYGGSARVAMMQQDGEAIITIDDDGPGIPPDRMASMFEPFVRGEASRNAQTGGAGLGLSIARQILRAHAGTIDLANREGGGLRVTVRLPGTG